jgi:hypothetical protein
LDAEEWWVKTMSSAKAGVDADASKAAAASNLSFIFVSSRKHGWAC